MFTPHQILEGNKNRTEKLRRQRVLVQALPPMAVLPWANYLIFLSIKTPFMKEEEKDYHYLFLHMKNFK